EAKLRGALRINFLLIAEGDRLQREDRFARFVHRLNVLLVVRRGCYRAKMTAAIYDNCYAGWNGCPADPGDKCFCLYSCRADADGPGLLETLIAHIDIVTAPKEIC